MRKVTVLLCCAFLFGCNFGDSEVEPNQFDRDFFRLSTDAQVKRFHEYDLQTQYELVIVGNQVVHPPAIYLAEEFAEQGGGCDSVSSRQACLCEEGSYSSRHRGDTCGNAPPKVL